MMSERDGAWHLALGMGPTHLVAWWGVGAAPRHGNRRHSTAAWDGHVDCSPLLVPRQNARWTGTSRRESLAGGPETGKVPRTVPASPASGSGHTANEKAGRHCRCPPGSRLDLSC